jgi:hypothetical protein
VPEGAWVLGSGGPHDQEYVFYRGMPGRVRVSVPGAVKARGQLPCRGTRIGCQVRQGGVFGSSIGSGDDSCGHPAGSDVAGTSSQHDVPCLCTH